MVSGIPAERRTLTVGAVLGLGHRGHGFQVALAKAARIVREREEADPPRCESVEAHVNVVFQVPGGAADPWPIEFDGLRAGRFTRAKRKLVIDVAVPDGLASEQAELFIASALVDGVALARAQLASKKVIAEFERAERVASAAAEELGMRAEVPPIDGPRIGHQGGSSDQRP